MEQAWIAFQLIVLLAPIAVLVVLLSLGIWTIVMQVRAFYWAGRE